MKTKFITFFFACSMMFACNNKYEELEDGLYAEFITSMGTMLIKLTYEKTPVTVANFVALAEGNHPKVDIDFKNKKYYNGIIFHRVIDSFMIQGGCPLGNGSGGPGYKFLDEFDESLKHNKKGILSMANSGRATNGSQFFITEGPTPHLDGGHTVFGELVQGYDVLDAISITEKGPKDRPKIDVVIKKLKIIRVGLKANNFNAVTVWNEMEPKLFITQEEKKRLAIFKKDSLKKIGKLDLFKSVFSKIIIEDEQKASFEKMDSLARIQKEINENYRINGEKLKSNIVVNFLKRGSGEKPNNGDEISFYYEGYLAKNGKLFGTNRKEIMINYGQHNEDMENKGWYDPTKITYSNEMQFIEGFKEALMMMNFGDKVYVFIPSEMGYGSRQAGQISPNSDLEFIIELVNDSN